MINTSSILAGFRNLQGSMGIHCAMAFVLIFLLEVHIDNLADSSSNLRKWLIFMHLFQTFAIQVFELAPTSYYVVANVLQMFAGMVQMYSTIFVCKELFETPADEKLNNIAYYYWLECEFLVFVTTILTSIGFLFIRCFIEEKNTVYLNISQQNEETDYLEVQTKNLNYLTTFVAMFLVSFFDDRFFGQTHKQWGEPNETDEKVQRIF